MKSPLKRLRFLMTAVLVVGCSPSDGPDADSMDMAAEAVEENGLGTDMTDAFDTADAEQGPVGNPWTEVYSDSGATPLATFQSHERKLRDHGGALTMAYTYETQAGTTANRTVRIPHAGTAETLTLNTGQSNAGCIVVWQDRLYHVHADYMTNTLLVDPMDPTKGGPPAARFPGFLTAGKTACLADADTLLVATSYSEIWALREEDGVITQRKLRDGLQLAPPESAQYPYFVEGKNAQGGVTLANVSAQDGFYYRDLYLSDCNRDGTACSEFVPTFAARTLAANSWVGDIARLKNGDLVAYWTENAHHNAFMKLFTEPESSIGQLGIRRDGAWNTRALGPRIMSARFLRDGDDLLLVTMTLAGEVSVERVEGGGTDVLSTGPQVIARRSLGIACAYGLDADLVDGVLSLVVTDRGAECANATGTVRVWRHTLSR